MITGAVCGYLCLSVRQLADVVKQVRAMHPRSQVPTVSLKAQKAPDTRKYSFTSETNTNQMYNQLKGPSIDASGRHVEKCNVA